MTALENNQRGKVLTPLSTRDTDTTLKKQTNKQKSLLLISQSGISDVFAALKVSQMGPLFLRTKPSPPCIFGASRCLFGHLRRNFPPRALPREHGFIPVVKTQVEVGQ